MKSKRIILSDDEDDNEDRGLDNRGVATPASSTEFLRDLSSLNMRSGSRISQTTGGRFCNGAAPNLSPTKKKNGIADNSGEEDCFGSSDELDPEALMHTMQGKNHSQEDADYEMMIQPVRASKSLSFSPSNASRSRNAERGGSSSRTAPASRNSRKQQQQESPGSRRPRRESAVRAEQRLHHLYSEYGEQTGEARTDDDSYDSGEGGDGGEGGKGEGDDGEGGGSNASRSDADGSDDFVVEDHDSDVPRRSRHRQDSRSSSDRNHHSRDKHPSPRCSASRGASATSATPAASRKEEKEASPSRESTRRSARSASLSSKKEQQYLRAHRDIQQKSRGGLETVLLSSSDEEVSDYNYLDANVDDEEDDIDMGAPKKSRSSHHFQTHSQSSPRRAHSSGSSQQQKRQSNRNYGNSPTEFSPVSSSRHRGGPSSSSKKGSKTQYSYSVSQLKSPAKYVGLMYRNDERAERGEDEDDSGSDINDFIVNSDEERAEEEARAEEAAYRKELRRQQRREEKARRNKTGSSKYTGQKAADIVASATATYNKEARQFSSGGSCAINLRDEGSDDGEVVLINSRSQRSSQGGAEQGT